MHVSANAEARQNAVDSVLDSAGPVSEKTSDDLFAVADLLDSSAQLRRTFTDSSIDASARQQIARSLLGGKVDAVAEQVVAEAVAQSWNSSRALASAVDRQGVRARLLVAERNNTLDDVEEGLFRFGRVVTSTPELRAALSNPVASADIKQELVRNLLAGKASEITIALAKRAVLARNRTFELTLEQYLNTSAALRRRSVATVRVAKPLSAEQEARLKAALIKQAGRPVTLLVIVDPATVGGVRVEMGSDVIDGTVAGRLAQARRQMA